MRKAPRRGVDAPVRTHGAGGQALQHAVAAHQAGDLPRAIGLFESLRQKEPRNLEVLNRLGVLTLQAGQVSRGVALLEQACLLAPAQAPMLANLGNGYLLAGAHQRALDCYDRALAIQPSFAGALSNRAAALQRLGRMDEAAQAFERLAAIDPAFPFVVGSRFLCKRQVCDWREFEPHREDILQRLAASQSVDRPFSFLSLSDDPDQQLRCAQVYATHLCGESMPVSQRRPAAGTEGTRRLRVAYVSADFRDHVMAYFIAPLLERHNRADFQVVGVTLAPVDGGPITARCREASDIWVDVSPLSDAAAAERLRSLDLDIAVDLMGYTQGCRPGIFTRRPAPVQVNFMGFPGTCGAPWLDYIIADDFVIPKEQESRYAERTVRMPHCFQVNDSRRLPPVRTVTRADCGLPEKAPVLCAFSNTYKLNPKQFGLWARVLRAAPAAVLWLLADSESASARLSEHAAHEGVAPERLIFAPRLPYVQHLARLGLADLLLDTLPFNAGATASDALWLGVPVLTCPGQSFASRMAGSLLQAAGLPELIAASPREYEALAIALANDPSALQRLKEKLASRRGTHPLFDGARYCSDLEQAYRLMILNWRQKGAPGSFDVTPSSHP